MSRVVRWFIRQLWRLVLITGILVIPVLFPAEWDVVRMKVRTLVPDARVLAGLRSAKQELELDAAMRSAALAAVIDTVRDDDTFDIEARLQAIDSELTRERNARRSAAERTLALVTGGTYRQDFEREIRIRFLESEASALQSIRADRLQIGRARTNYIRERARHVELYAEWQAVVRRQAAYERQHWLVTGSPLRQLDAPWRQLEAERLRLVQVTRQAAARVTRARRAWQTAKSSAATISQTKADVGEILATLNEQIRARQRVEAIGRGIRRVLPSATLVLALLIAVPIAIKALCYFVIAPFASRRPPIRLVDRPLREPEPCDAQNAADTGRSARSSVSQVLWIDSEHELLVHPEYLQTSSDDSQKATKWLLDWQIPLSSLASGMMALTRLRATSRQRCVISSTVDPFSEIALVELGDDDAMVLQPHNLIGVRQPLGRPLRITRHWRIFSWSAWLTLQFRYLVFHGPATLIVAGCRGVRIEAAEHGRSIDQAATIGFSANLAYATRRSETFGAYLLGKHGLFNDSFAGGPGVYVYEEMPHFGKKSGLTGRGLEGMVDTVLKAFGV